MSKSLEKFINQLEADGFKATQKDVGERIVVHGVAGSGKTSLIKKFLGDPDFAFFNPIPGKIHRIDGVTISSELIPKENKINVLDEYLRADSVAGFDILFADPYQYDKLPLVADFVKSTSHRFKSELTDLLRTLGFEIYSSEPGLEIVRGSGYEIETEGTIIAIELEVLKLLSDHGLAAFEPHCVQGKEFETVTFVHSRDLDSLNKTALYLALTRVQKRLLILQV